MSKKEKVTFVNRKSQVNWCHHAMTHAANFNSDLVGVNTLCRDGYEVRNDTAVKDVSRLLESYIDTFRIPSILSGNRLHVWSGSYKQE